MSNPAFARTTPVTPPTVKRNKNPVLQRYCGVQVGTLPANVKIQEKTLTPVGIAITIVAAVKYARVSKSIPIMNIWCAQTAQPKTPIAAMA